MDYLAAQHESPWPHRWAVALVCATFPMIWIGGLVTTYGAGMAVPDWPNTYGYNLFLYPWQTWVFGPWKLFIEHGHRLLGTLVGLLAIGFLISTFWCQQQKNLRWLGVAALVGVLLQGALGGLRVLANEVQIAKIHGIVGPTFFAFTVALAVISSRRWHEVPSAPSDGLGKIRRMALVTTLLVFCQLVLGAQLRHLPSGGRPGEFRLVLFFHLAVAAGVLSHAALVALAVARQQRNTAWLLRPAIGLLALVVLQLGLGGGTWITNYGWPQWMTGYTFAASYVTTADGGVQSLVTTAHVAIGALILAIALLVTLRAARLANGLPTVSTTAIRFEEALV